MSINKLVYSPFSTGDGTAKIIYDFLYHVISACHSEISLWHTNTPAQNTPVMEQRTAPWLHTVSSGKEEKKLHSTSLSFFTLLFIHSYNNYPCVKEYGKAALTDHKARLPRIEYICDYFEVNTCFYFSTFISNIKCFTKAHLLPFRRNSKFEPPLPYPWYGCSHLCWPWGIFSPAQLDTSTWAGGGSVPQEPPGLWNCTSMCFVSSKLDQICFFWIVHHFLTGLTPEQTAQ